jgi:glycosyltransferase involved in cell wall biosynthesis
MRGGLSWIDILITDVIIPAVNEEKSIGKVIADIPKEYIRFIVVVDNGSKDQTARVASQAGALMISEPRRGYGRACLAGINYLKGLDLQPDIVLFLDGDYSDHPEEAIFLLKPIIEGGYEFVLGSRALGDREKGSMTIPQLFGNWLATRLLKILFGGRFTDLGPFRAILWPALVNLKMVDKNFGWTVEMQIKVLKHNLKIKEIPVSYRKRLGKSKVSGTFKGSLMAGYKILITIFKYSFS